MLSSEAYVFDEQGRTFGLRPSSPLLSWPVLGALAIHVIAGVLLLGFQGGVDNQLVREVPAVIENEIVFMAETVTEPVSDPVATDNVVVMNNTGPVEPAPVEEIIETAQAEEIVRSAKMNAIQPPKRPKAPRQVSVRIAATNIQSVANETPSRVQAVRTSSGISAFVQPQYPEYLHNPAPPYPRKARQKRQEGTVRIRVWISETGKVLRTRLHASSGFRLLDKSALKAVKFWRFLPALSQGQAVAGDVIVPIRFALDQRSG